MKSTKIVLVAVLYFISTPEALLAQPAAHNPAAIQQANADLDSLAQELAKLVSEPGFRGFLRSEIAKSKNRENILELDKFMERASKRQGGGQGIGKFKDKAKTISGKIKKSNLNTLEGLDIYIPVDAHRTKWKGGKDFLVASVPLTDEKDIKHIVAYQVWDGKRIFLDPNRAPEKVVLVIAPEEHENHDLPPPPVRDPNLPTNNDPKDTGKDLEKPGKYGSGNSSIGTPYLKIMNDHEGWFSGDPEIYAILYQAQPYASGGYSCAVGSWPKGLYSMVRINKTNQWYSTPISRYFDSTYHDKVTVRIMESDGGTRKTMLYEIVPGVTCRWIKFSNDDHVGTGSIYKSAFPYNYKKYHAFGDVRVYWLKTH